MSYMDIEQELNKITGNLKKDLRAANAIDATDHVINKAAFNRVIDEKIDKCNAMRAEMEVSGRRFDPNTANIIGANIDFLRSIKGAGTLDVRTSHGPDRESEMIEKAQNKKATNGFLDGIKKLFRKNPTPIQTHGREK